MNKNLPDKYMKGYATGFITKYESHFGSNNYTLIDVLQSTKIDGSELNRFTKAFEHGTKDGTKLASQDKKTNTTSYLYNDMIKLIKRK